MNKLYVFSLLSISIIFVVFFQLKTSNNEESLFKEKTPLAENSMNMTINETDDKEYSTVDYSLTGDQDQAYFLDDQNNIEVSKDEWSVTTSSRMQENLLNPVVNLAPSQELIEAADDFMHAHGYELAGSNFMHESERMRTLANIVLDAESNNIDTQIEAITHMMNTLQPDEEYSEDLLALPSKLIGMMSEKALEDPEAAPKIMELIHNWGGDLNHVDKISMLADHENPSVASSATQTLMKMVELENLGNIENNENNQAIHDKLVEILQRRPSLFADVH